MQNFLHFYDQEISGPSPYIRNLKSVDDLGMSLGAFRKYLHTRKYGKRISLVMWKMWCVMLTLKFHYVVMYCSKPPCVILPPINICSHDSFPITVSLSPHCSHTISLHKQGTALGFLKVLHHHWNWFLFPLSTSLLYVCRLLTLPQAQ